jgi:hypothetical protein
MTTPTTVQVKFQLRGDTAANWASVNPVLLNNELGLETDTKKLKVGNGSTAWNSLAYFPSIVTGGTVLGNLEIGTTGTLTFEGSTADGFETTLAVTDPTADRTITLPNVSGTVVTTGDTGSVTSTMLADGTIVDGDVNASAAIAGTKISPNFGSQTIQTTGIFSHALGTDGAPTITFTGDANTGIYSPGADQVAISTNGTQRILIEDDGDININSGSFFFDNGFNRLGIGTATPAYELEVTSTGEADIQIDSASTYDAALRFAENGTNAFTIYHDASDSALAIYDNQNTTERLRITSDGKLGLGTSSPAPAIGNGTTLHLYGASTTSELRLQRGNGTDLSLFAGSATGGAAISLNNKFSISTDSNSTQAFTVDTSGRVGIGVTSPATTLDVNGDVTIADKIIHGGDTNTAIRFPAADTVSVETAGNERARIDSSGRLLVGTVSDSGGALLQVNGNRVRVATAKTPASASDTGTTGEICWDANYVYVCTATNTWKRTAISTW